MSGMMAVPRVHAHEETRAVRVHEAQTFRAEIPIPPSVNNLFSSVSSGRGGRTRRIVTSAYRQWKERAGWELTIAGGKPVRGPYRLTVMLPAKMRGDIDNRVKATSDLLVSLGLTPDDHHAVSVHAERNADVPQGRAIVIVESAA